MEETGIIDIHSHILPGVDDGSDSMETTLKMLAEAYRQGVRTVIATPHGSPAFPQVAPERYRSLLAEVQQRAGEKLPGMEFFLGQEIYYTRECIRRLESGELLSMAGTSYVLVEFPYAVAYRELYGAVRELVWARYRPILAHIERYGCLRTEGRTAELSEAGAYLQVNFGSVGGGRFNGRARWCKRELAAGRVHFLGSDMHNLTSRRPELSQALSWMERHLDGGYLQELLRGNAGKLLKNAAV